MEDPKNFARTPTSWDAEDDVLLMHLKDSQKLGWKEIASHFTNRTPNACQFRWRRLKSGNLKNPPKSLGAGSPGSGGSGESSPRPRPKPKGTKVFPPPPAMTPSRANSASGFAAFGLGPSPVFTGYDNNVSSALAGLNALSNPPSNISTPGSYQPSPVPPAAAEVGEGGLGGNGLGLGSRRHSSYGSVLDPDPAAAAAAGGSGGGGYYADISIDPTMNLPHNQPHPHAAAAPSRGSSRRGSHGTPAPHLLHPARGSRSYSHSGVSSAKEKGAPGAPGAAGGAYHHNSIIQVKDERASVSSSRASVSSLPSKSMNIPHHRSNSMAHLPLLGGSFSGASPHPSVSGSVSQPTVVSLRTGSVNGHHAAPAGGGYYSRSGSVVIPYNADKREEYKVDKKSNSAIAAAAVAATTKHFQNHISKPSKGAAAGSTPSRLFKIPWSMEEDELLINRRNRELSFAELSILLPQRTEGEIWSRIDHLEELRSGHRARDRRQSSIGLDDDLYDVLDSEDDEVLVDVEDQLGMARKKRRASSAVNPLSVDRKRLR
ncbi:Myb-like domain-containing protein [[Candida] zeylanoides]